MITENQTEQISEVFAKRYQEVYDKYLTIVGTHLKEIGTLSPTDIHRLEQLAKMNKNIDEIRKDLEKVSSLNSDEMNRIFRRVSEEEYANFTKFYSAKGMVQAEIQKQVELKKQLNAIGKITEEAFVNLSNTTVMSDLYKKCVDKGILAAQQGLTDYRSAIRDVIKNTAIEGNKVQYESGYKRRRDTAARMNVLDGIRDINMEIARQTGAEFGADGVEISAHTCCAPDHLDYQGKQFTNAEFDSLQETLERRFGVWNCHHTIFPVILGISKPAYSNSDLQKMRDYSTEKITIGKYTKSRYQWTQVQRKLETKVREQKDIANIAKASGDDVLRREAQAKINKYTGIYENVSKASGIPTKKERMAVSGFRAVKADKITLKEARFIDNIINWPPQKGDVINPRNIFKELNKSDVGKQAINYIVENKIPIDIYYGRNNAKPGVRGQVWGNSIIIYAYNTKTIKCSSQTIIHEVTHLQRNIGHSQWAEAVCFCQEKKHVKNLLTISDLRVIIKEVKELYAEYSWR